MAPCGGCNDMIHRRHQDDECSAECVQAMGGLMMFNDYQIWSVINEYKSKQRMSAYCKCRLVRLAYSFHCSLQCGNVVFCFVICSHPWKRPYLWIHLRFPCHWSSEPSWSVSKRFCLRNWLSQIRFHWSRFLEGTCPLHSSNGCCLSLPWFTQRGCSEISRKARVKSHYWLTVCQLFGRAVASA